MRDPSDCKSVERRPNRNLMDGQLNSNFKKVIHTSIGRLLHGMSRFTGVKEKGIIGEAIQQRCLFHHLKDGVLDRRGR